MYVVIVGAGKVGWNLARELINKRHEVTVIEADAHRYAVVEQELEHSAMYGDGSELWVLERSGIERADLVVAVTGDDEDNILISQVAREKYGVARVVARCNNPRNLQHFELLGVRPVISATDLILRLIEHEVPKYGLVHLLDLPEERLEIIELEVAEGSPAAGRAVKELGLPDGSLVISILREGGGFVPTGDSVIEPNDEVLVVLDVGIESRVTDLARPAGRLARDLDPARGRRLRADRRLGDRAQRRGAGSARRRHRIARDRAVHRPHGRIAVARRKVDHLIIGGGLAAANCARWLREEGGEGSILLVGREPDPPYNRPPLSKGYLQGRESREDALFRPDEWWDEQNIERLQRTSVMKLDSSERVATLSTKEEIEFETALLATGANVKRLRVDGCDLDGIHYLRAFANSDAIRAEAETRKRAVLIGGSYIGCEVAASLTAAHGVDCTIVMMEDVTFEPFFGERVGRFFQDVLEEHGVTVHGGEELERFEGDGERVTKVVTKSGLELDCDFVVAGIGVTPDVTLARGAGLALGEQGGVRCSAHIETSETGIYAAGDICEYDSPVHGKPMRIEHWDVAFNQGKTAAFNMLGRGLEHTVVPYFFSDLADWVSMEYVGPGSGEAVIRGSLEQGKFAAFYVDDGRETAAMSVGRSDDLDHARRFISERTQLDTATLADPDADLASV